jgi:hypothetical protein
MNTIGITIPITKATNNITNPLGFTGVGLTKASSINRLSATVEA